jgi:trigger factor
LSATLERLEGSRVVLDVRVEVPDVERALDAAYRRLVGRVNIPGFRRGKAPRAVFERFVGRSRLWQEALDPLVQEAFDAAVEESGIEPMTSPEVELAAIEDGQPLRFKATVTVRPEVELGDYRGIALAREPVEVGDDDVQRALEELRERRARWVPVEDAPAERGMLVVIDVTGEVGGEPADPETGVGAVLGSGQLRPALEEGIEGMRPGETREVAMSFPDDDADAKIAGKSGRFQVVLRECKRKELPALDDDFARDVSEAASLEELRSWLKNRLREAAEARAEQSLADRCVALVTDEARVDVPAVLVDQQVEAAVRELAAEMARAGSSLDAYLASQGKGLDDLRAELRPRAERRAKTRLVLEAVARREGLEPTSEEVRRRIERMAAQYGQKAEAFHKAMRRPDLQAEVRGDIRLEQAVSFLKERALANAGQGVAGEA